MTDPQIINTPAGEEMAVLPLEEYKQLLRSAEELVDIRAYDEAIQRLAAGHDESSGGSTTPGPRRPDLTGLLLPHPADVCLRVNTACPDLR